jgi:hypothetical protein
MFDVSNHRFPFRCFNAEFPFLSVFLFQDAWCASAAFASATVPASLSLKWVFQRF